MSRAGLLATFANERALVAAAREAQAAGITVVDAYTPYPVQALYERIGAEPSPVLARACAAGAVAGALGATAFQVWTSAVDWPLNVGGKPLPAWLAYVPVTFEATVLCAAVATFVTFLAVSGLGRRQPRTRLPRVVSDDGFVLQVVASADASRERAVAWLRTAGALRVDVLPDDTPAAAHRGPLDVAPRRALLRGAAAVALASAVSWWAVRPDASRPNLVYAPDMAISPAARTYGPALATLGPPAGAVSRGDLPLRYEATEADAQRAAAELTMPPRVGTPYDRRWAETAFADFCLPCHGREGHGDGITIKRGFQPPPSLLTQHARDMKDGQMFHVLTYGQKLMPPHTAQLSVDDRWRLILHVRGLQRRLPVDPPPFGSAPPAPPTVPQ